MTDSPDAPIATPPGPPSGKRILSVCAGLLFLVAAGALAGRMFSQLSKQPTITPPLNFVLEKDTAALRARQRDLVGKFTTGTQSGDRAIEMTAEGRIRFYMVGPLERALESTDRYQIGSIERHPAVATEHSGTIEIVDLDHLKYFGDTYQRAK